MKVLYKNDRTDSVDWWVTSANEWLACKTERYRAKSLYLPAGDTPKQLYADWRKSPPSVLERLELYQLDDIVDGRCAGMFAQYFADELPDYLVHPPEEEIRADLGILGLGSNGHVAFHEPDVPMSFEFGEVELSVYSFVELGVKPGTRAITYGVNALMQAKALLLLVTNRKKLDVFKDAVGLNQDLPITHLVRKHPDLTVLISA